MKYQSEKGRQPVVSPNKRRLRSAAGAEAETACGESDQSTGVPEVDRGCLCLLHAGSGLSFSCCLLGPQQCLEVLQKQQEESRHSELGNWVIDPTKQLTCVQLGGDSRSISLSGFLPASLWPKSPFLPAQGGCQACVCCLAWEERSWGKWEFPCPPEAHLLSSSSLVSDLPLSLSPCFVTENLPLSLMLGHRNVC